MKYSMKKIIVCGAGGFIGSHLVTSLKVKGCYVIGVDLKYPEFSKSNADEFGINPDVFDKYNVHIHVPEGATPKDGPSAGTAITTAIYSLLTNQ